MKIIRYDLRKPQTIEFWKILIPMSLSYGWARELFREMKRQVFSFRKIVLFMLYDNKNKPIAWNLVLKGERAGDNNYVWAFTKPRHRQKGCQKILLKHTARYYKDLTFQADIISRQKTFAYYEQNCGRG